MSHISFYYYPIAWHSHFPVVHLHSQPYRMLRAISTNNLDEIVTLLDNGFPIDAKLEQKYGFTAMQLAAINNHFPLLEILCLRGANPNLPDKWGNTPIMHAVTHRSHEAIHSLLRNGGDPSIQNQYGLSAIDKAEDAPSIR
jgi:ankyrin repeat protein